MRSSSLRNRPISDLKTIEIVAGPNGSGKTTFAESYLLRVKQNLIFLNPDLIASGIAPLDFERASFQAGRVLITEVKNQIAQRKSFAFESTLSGKTWAHLLSKAVREGYHLTIHFLFLDSVQQNIARIKKRVKMGGHNIPADAVLRRQSRCFENFWGIYRPLAHDWYIFNNSATKPKLILSRATYDSLPAERQLKFENQFLTRKPHGQKIK